MGLESATGFIALVVGLVISFIPTLVAYLRNNIYKKQVLIYQIIMLVAGFVVSLVFGLLSQVIPFMVIFSILWSVFSCVAWIYILVNAIKNTRMTILSKFGINI